MIGLNSKFKKFKKTWIERCRHLCVCPLIDHRRGPIRMRELLGLLYKRSLTWCSTVTWNLLNYHYKIPPVYLNTREAKIIDNEIQTLLNKGVYEEAQPSQHKVISSIFLRKKNNGSYRMIFNLKRLNECIEYKHFKMESLSLAVQLMRKLLYGLNWLDPCLLHSASGIWAQKILSVHMGW